MPEERLTSTRTPSDVEDAFNRTGEIRPLSSEQHIEFMRVYLGYVGALVDDSSDEAVIRAYEKHTRTPLVRKTEDFASISVE